ncbi:hypothetical protein B4153_3869 [Bacillus cereus]|nr:hypothetical protein B4153_3869 [Bacillus cereus]KLA05947.1 hypothetical protein B4086_3584 [Bacillus cereus]KLA14044.1 hypothetical protein B4078_3730 [Bacillus cereus]
MLFFIYHQLTSLVHQNQIENDDVELNTLVTLLLQYKY